MVHAKESESAQDKISRSIEADGDSLVTDLHVWQVASGRFAAIVGVVAHDPKSAEEYRAPLREHEELAHVTIEVQRCDDAGHTAE